MKFRSKVMLLGVTIVLLPMLVSTFAATRLVFSQNEKDAHERIRESTARIIRELQSIEAQYAERGRKYAKTDNLVMYTNVLFRYHKYLTPEGYATVQNSLSVDLTKLKIGLNVDNIEVRDAYNKLLARDASSGAAVPADAAASPVRAPRRDGTRYLLQGGRFILQSTSTIQKRDRLLGYLILTKYLDANFLKEVSGVNGTEVAFFRNNRFLDGTIARFPVTEMAHSDLAHPIQIKIQKTPYSFIFSPIYAEGNDQYYVAVGVSYLKTLQKINETARILIGVAVGAMLIALVLIYFWSGRTVGPLLRLVNAVQAIGRGDLGQKITVESSDEIGLLASEFNQMTTSLQESRSQLEDANRNLFEMKEYISNIVDSMTMSLVVVDSGFRITVVNLEFEKWLGESRERLVGRSLEDLLELGDGALLHKHLLRVIETHETQILTKVHCKIGTRKIVANIRFSPLEDVEQSSAGVVMIIEDITSRVNLEEKLAISQRLASIGNLDAGLAHEVNNPLGIILNYIEVCRMDTQDEKLDSYLKKIGSETERIAGIIQRLLEFSRQSETRFKPVNLPEIIEETVDLVEFKLRKENIVLERDYGLDEAWVMADKSRLKQVFLNIILNAVQSMPGGGRLAVRLAESGDGQGFDLAFCDSGRGIPKEHLSRIFDPFFTTKEVGEGTGLGLSVSYGIIQEHFGTIDVKSTEGKGSTFTVRLKKIASEERSSALS
ncbi:PAS domain S-box-containing protein [Hydrogenispora ethanolica]|uniref:histidine kinase n=1 Tax=Hydrogenispora ethanolica TaxID=1082276 RepID=A0A4R1QX58_HYDET|nr:ATP-binding protein [Hydrogenispora ethanolica]TCL56034.1 PAS domain S-box-containing protein [Hydrogenispora ethanolica]